MIRKEYNNEIILNAFKKELENARLLFSVCTECINWKRVETVLCHQGKFWLAKLKSKFFFKPIAST